MSAPGPIGIRDPLAFHGRVELHRVESRTLAGNRVGDPHVRELPIYLPPGADAPGAGFPVIFVLAGFTGRGHGYLETHPWREGPVVTFDRAVAAGAAPPAILALPDCFTRLGGSQYVNSSYLGDYEDHVVDELVAVVDERCPTLAGRRGIAGKSSGGFGALRLAMRHPDVFRACASISGDCGFELFFPGEFLSALRGLVEHDMDPALFLSRFLEEPDLGGDAHAVLDVLAMAACYSPAPDTPLGFELPFELRSGRLVDQVWRRWLEFDPVNAVEHHVDALKSLELLHLECGLRDEFHLQWGLRRLVERLEELGVPFVHEEHSGGHRGIDERYAPVLSALGTALSGA